MDDKNKYLDSYKKKLGDQQEAQGAENSTPEEKPASLRFAEKSSFVRPGPVTTGGRSSAAAGARKPGKALFIYLAAAVILCVVLVWIWYNSRTVEVIDLSDWTVNDAQLWAGDNAIKLQIDEQYNDQFDEGKIISQDAKPGSKINKGSFLKITVSLGHDLSIALSLPDLMSMTKSEIETWAAENFMTKVRITTEYSDKIASGQVIRYEINDNTVVDEVKRNTPVYIIISKGKEEKTDVLITIPNFKQMTIPLSQEFAKENGLVLKVIEKYDNYAAEGTIMSQSVKADEKVSQGTEVTLTVSLGKKIILPDFAEYSRQKALAVAAQLGITATVTEKYSDQPAGDFLGQSIEAGTIGKSGDFLELTYSLGNQVVVSSFVGQTRAAIETWAMDLNKQGASIAISASYTQSNSPKDQIIVQNKSNTLVNIDVTIRITVSLGKMIFTPDFVAPEGSDYNQAITREKALTLCTELGIIPIFVADAIAGRLPGEIWQQSIEAGKEILEGSTITLRYNPANVTLTVPNFLGLTKAQIIAANYMKSFDITFVTFDTYVQGYSDKVFQQSLKANTTVTSGSAITLTVSQPAPPPTPTPEPSPTPTPTPTPEPTPTPTPEPTQTSAPTQTSEATQTSAPTQTSEATQTSAP